MRTDLAQPSVGRRRLRARIFLATAIGGASVVAACGDDPVPAAPGAPVPADAGAEDAPATGDAAAADATPPGPCDDDVPAAGELWKTLACTGIDGPEVRAYRPALELWADGAAKSRRLFLPKGAVVDARDPDDWVFPNGTKAWKEFSLEGRKIETRLLYKDEGGVWRRGTYRWNEAGTSATRVDDGAVVPSGDAGYEIPSQTACDQCHAGKRDTLLGVEAVSLGLPGAEGLTLATLVAEGTVVPAPPATTFTLPDDGTGLAAPAAGWLHANCGNVCHNDGPRSAGRFVNGFRMRVKVGELSGPAAVASASELELVRSLVSVPTSRGVGELGVVSRVEPGAPDASGVVLLAGTRTPGAGSTQMPPLVTRQVDATGLGHVRAWIAALAPPP